MTASTDVALESFESFINKEGEVVQAGLNDHFEILGQHLSSQDVSVSSVVVVSNTVSYLSDLLQQLLHSTPPKHLQLPFLLDTVW